MEIYSYEVIDSSGRMLTGEIEADEEWAAIESLQQRGFTVLDIENTRSSSFSRLFRTRSRGGIGDLSLFSRELAASLEAGIPLTRSLYTLSQQATNPTLQEALGQIARNVESGVGFADSLAAYPDIFSPFYLNMVRSGELGGSLAEALQNLSEQLEKNKFLRDQVRSAVFYPAVVLSFALAVVLAMIIFIVPVFMDLLPAGVSLPWPTRIVLGISDSLRHGWYFWLLGIIALVLGLRLYLRSPGGIRAWDQVKFRLPVFGNLAHRVTIARFCRTLSTLLAGGIPLLQALESAGPAVGNTLIADAVQEAGEKIQQGKDIATPLKESGVFPPLVVQMVAVGEETGSLPLLLKKMAEFYEAEVEALTKGLTSVIEPVLLIVIGLIIGFLVIAMYLPMFVTITTIGG
jgi:type IV pilus assembly protein PilC